MRRSWFYLAAVVLLGLAVAMAGCSAGGGQAGTSLKKTAPGDKPAPGKSADQGTSGKGADRGFREYPIGDEQEVEGLSIAAVYFQPVDMEPSAKAGLRPDQADIHLEADIVSAEGNQTGFGVGEFVPYLTVSYRLKNLSTGQEQKGSLMPMNASDGPHYGANVKMPGAGKYRLTFLIESPEKQDYLLHVDKETGVEGRFWKKPLEVSWEFNFVPRKW